jgi:hypothetical protein
VSNYAWLIRYGGYLERFNFHVQVVMSFDTFAVPREVGRVTYTKPMKNAANAQTICPIQEMANLASAAGLVFMAGFLA